MQPPRLSKVEAAQSASAHYENERVSLPLTRTSYILIPDFVYCLPAPLIISLLPRKGHVGTRRYGAFSFSSCFSHEDSHRTNRGPWWL